MTERIRTGEVCSPQGGAWTPATCRSRCPPLVIQCLTGHRKPPGGTRPKLEPPAWRTNAPYVNMPITLNSGKRGSLIWRCVCSLLVYEMNIRTEKLPLPPSTLTDLPLIRFLSQPHKWGQLRTIMTSDTFQCKEIILIGQTHHSHTHGQTPAGCYGCLSVPTVTEMKVCPQEGYFLFSFVN